MLARRVLRALLPAVALLAGTITLAQAQSRTLATLADTKKTAQAIVASVASGSYPAAIQEMRPLTAVPPAEFDAFQEQVRGQLETLLQRFGTATGYEHVREERLGTRLVRHQLLVFHEKAPVRWLFIFYRTDKGWVITDFKFDVSAPVFFGSGN